MRPHSGPPAPRAGQSDTRVGTDRFPDDDVPVEALGDLYRDGITACPGAFSVDWVDQVGEDIDAAFREARSRPDGAVGRGPERWYVEIHPEQLRGFVDLVTHPWVVAVCRAVLGPDYEIVELGFDIPFPGAAMQPWHRDFPRYERRAVRKYPRRGDISARSALTIHRGTPNVSSLARPVLVLGVDAPGAGNASHHDMAVTRGYWASLPELVRAHLPCPVVDTLVPIRQKHTIEGLVMGAE
ncbi:phytanoyl-CoA dioxygenase [Micromonospora sp. S4605]|uniref:phytanoyl-CoA dioxygenase family protein n=1 Tax=Micromonospora sp. S4605 TaxID=1420897 RepID=UPI000D70096F|nr:phytanoyl-CoA dioxygenase family protein [Micromonospora sp. S4605]PWU51929.1 phytanoyl-CoA dioxygenase [Micromonospora sp. S4605]